MARHLAQVKRSPDEPVTDPAPEVPLWTALRFWLQLGLVSFGGPAAQIALMHEHLVDRRRWISEARFQHALNYCTLLPGPEAQQLATYLGWLMHRNLGGIAAGLLFILPSFLLLSTLAWGYVRYGEHPLAAGLLGGVAPAVVALVISAGWRMARRTLRTPRLTLIAVAGFLGLHLLALDFALIVAGAALIGAGGGLLLKTREPIADDPSPAVLAAPSLLRLSVMAAAGLLLWLAGYLACSLTASGLTEMAGFFTRAALVTFGGAYAVLPYVHQAAVEQYQWITGGQMQVALALGETTPGPLIMIVAFVAFIGGHGLQLFGPDMPVAAGWVAALVAVYFTFLPSFVFILVGAPLVEYTRQVPRLHHALTAISAAVVGLIAELGLTLAQSALWQSDLQRPNWLACAAVALALWLLVKRNASPLLVVVLFGAAGALLHLSGISNAG